MLNTITVTIPFAFKGENHTPSCLIDLDDFIDKDMAAHFLFHIVAMENKIDKYSYQYEVLESSPILFSQPTGIAEDFLEGSSFNFDRFKSRSHTLRIEQQLNDIAATIDASKTQKSIVAALYKAFETGRNYQQ
jgi:hypothetical protein